MPLQQHYSNSNYSSFTHRPAPLPADNRLGTLLLDTPGSIHQAIVMPLLKHTRLPWCHATKMCMMEHAARRPFSEAGSASKGRNGGGGGVYYQGGGGGLPAKGAALDLGYLNRAWP